jgi:hypothetical protein
MFLLHLHYPATGRRETLSFPTAYARLLWMITLAAQPVALRREDVTGASEDVTVAS